jgi:CubicO group peptidase (beta-lactamase class C family)
VSIVRNKTRTAPRRADPVGFVYPRDDSILTQYLKANPVLDLFDPKATVDALSSPLIYEPGTSFRYSVSIDWVGIMVERVSGLNLESYFRQNIFDPVGAESFTFYPTPEVQRRKIAACERDAQGKVKVIPGGFGMGRPQEPEQVGLLLGGAGLFGTQKDYLAVLRAVLRCDPRYPHRPSKPLISPESYAEMFKPCLPRGQGYTGCDVLFAMVNPSKYLDNPMPENVNHSVAFLINQEPLRGRRKANSGCWSGAAKTQFWIDPESGIAVSSEAQTKRSRGQAICGTHLLGPSPDPWFATYTAYETDLYAGLK